MSAVPPRDEKYEEIDSTLREVVKLFSERDTAAVIFHVLGALSYLHANKVPQVISATKLLIPLLTN